MAKGENLAFLHFPTQDILIDIWGEQSQMWWIGGDSKDL